MGSKTFLRNENFSWNCTTSNVLVSFSQQIKGQISSLHIPELDMVDWQECVKEDNDEEDLEMKIISFKDPKCDNPIYTGISSCGNYNVNVTLTQFIMMLTI